MKFMVINYSIYGCNNNLKTQCVLEHIILFRRADPESEESGAGTLGQSGEEGACHLRFPRISNE